MIKSFRDSEAELVWSGDLSRRLPQDIQTVALRKLRMLNNAKQLRDLALPPNNRLEAFRGDRRGQHSIRINRQWRICFRASGRIRNMKVIENRMPIADRTDGSPHASVP
ncbi:MAG: type II toxin-antitoxin system RelE/ParE family toxin [Alphaproteobacteria bacterium]|nr:type II toxin-antitoxin system RelE/ParE family toxin [Alphaproteobacteria bacterium]